MKYCECDENVIYNKTRKRTNVVPRHLTMYFMRKKLNMSYDDIGKQFGAHHTSAIHAVRTISDAIKVKDPSIHDLSLSISLELRNETLLNNQSRLVVYYPEDFDVHSIIPILNSKCKNLKYEFI
jgi:hypothetical protein